MACAETFESSLYIVAQCSTKGQQTLLYDRICNSNCELNVGFYARFQQLQLFNSYLFCKKNLCGVNIRSEEETELYGNREGIQKKARYTAEPTNQQPCSIWKVKMNYYVCHLRNVLLLLWTDMTSLNYIQHTITIEACCKKWMQAHVNLVMSQDVSHKGEQGGPWLILYKSGALLASSAKT